MDNSCENILADASRKTNMSIKRKTELGELEIIDNDCTGDWGKIPGENKKYRKFVHFSQKNPNEWNVKDLFYFFSDLFKKTIGDNFVIAIAPGQEGILKLQDAFIPLLGKAPSSEMVKDYIEWFISNKAQMLISKYNCFKMKFMHAPYNVEEFLAINRIEKNKVIPTRTGKGKEANIYNEKAMEAVYLSSVNNFVLKYGLILSVIWMMRKIGMSEMQSVSLVKASAIEITGDGKYDDLVIATERHNPYPIWCKFASLNKLLVDLTAETNEFYDILDTRFSETAEIFGFLNNKE